MNAASSQSGTEGSFGRFFRAAARTLASLLTLALAWTAAGVAQAREVAPPPANSAAPTISREGEAGTPTSAIEGRELTATSGSWSGTAPVTYRYQWYSCTPEEEGCSPIAGATGATFTPNSAYLGRALRVTVTAEDAAGSATASAWSSEVRPVGGDAVSFGHNFHTELGAGYKDHHEDQPVPVIDLSDVTQVLASDEYSLVLLDNGTVRSFGDNDFGQLGDGKQGAEGENWAHLESYVTVEGLKGVKRLAAANDHVMALLENGTVETWGVDWHGQLGNGTAGNFSSDQPNVVPGLSKVIAIATGGKSDYALLSNHTMMAWGENQDGELGIGAIGAAGGAVEEEHCFPNYSHCEPTPHEVGAPLLNGKGEAVKNENGEPEITPLTHVAAISAGENMAYALLEDGRVMAWGDNEEGQLGNGAKEGLKKNMTPTEVKFADGEPLEGVEMVSADWYGGLALKHGAVYGWGTARGGELGEVEDPESCVHERVCVKAARRIPGLEDVSEISGGEGYNLALSGGTIYGFGYDNAGELGDGTLTSTSRPEPVKGIGTVVEVSAEMGDSLYSHSLALLATGVSPPSPPVSIEAKAHSLHISWNLPQPEYELRYRVWSPRACEAESGKGEECKGGWLERRLKLHEVNGYELTGLVANTPYEVLVRAHDKGSDHTARFIQGTPLG